MYNRETVVTSILLALGTLAMAFVIGSGAYVRAAGAEARGVHALAAIVAGADAPAGSPAALALVRATPKVKP